MNKKLFALLLVLALLLGCSPAVFAASVVLSNQSLKVDGVPVRCEMYNIDGNNYFKLRDLAYLLNGTGSQFAVDYDSATRRILVTTGTGYSPVGSELLFSGEDKSATAVPSNQPLLVDGREITGIAVYNIGNNNYFQLRDLKDALRFAVDYDSSTRTVLVNSLRAEALRELTPEEIYASCAPAVFYVEIYDETGWCMKTGSGFFLTSGGLAITNYHVISGADSASITVSDTGRVYSVLGVYDYNVEEDWAVLQIDGSGFQTLEIGDPGYDVGGATVYAIGSPLGLQNTISQGIISNPSRRDGAVNYIQMSAAIYPGSSGGALLNKYGQVIGITSATYTDGQNLNLAIPMTYLENMSAEEYLPFSDHSDQPSGVLTLSRNTLELTLREEGVISATAVEQNCSGVTIRYSIQDEDIVSCTWGEWNGDDIDLYVEPLSIGSTEVTVYFLISETETVLDSESVQVTVSAENSGSGPAFPVDFEVSTREVLTGLFEPVDIAVYAYSSVDDDKAVIRRTISDPYVVECTWSEWDGNWITLKVNPLSAGQSDIRISYSLEDGTLLAEETVHVSVFYGTITADTEQVTLAPGESQTVVFSSYASGGEWFTLRYEFVEEGIAEAEWGDWYDNGSDCPLTITGVRSGSTVIEIRMIDSDTEYCMATLRLPVQMY